MHLLFASFPLVFIISSFGTMAIIHAYAQASQVRPNGNNTNTNSLDIQNIVAKKFHI
jgi:hypothetical protein